MAVGQGASRRTRRRCGRATFAAAQENERMLMRTMSTRVVHAPYFESIETQLVDSARLIDFSEVRRYIKIFIVIIIMINFRSSMHHLFAKVFVFTFDMNDVTRQIHYFLLSHSTLYN